MLDIIENNQQTSEFPIKIESFDSNNSFELKDIVQNYLRKTFNAIRDNNEEGISVLREHLGSTIGFDDKSEESADIASLVRIYSILESAKHSNHPALLVGIAATAAAYDDALNGEAFGDNKDLKLMASNVDALRAFIVNGELSDNPETNEAINLLLNCDSTCGEHQDTSNSCAALCVDTVDTPFDIA